MLFGPIFSLALFATYFPQGVFVLITITVVSQFLVSRSIYYQKDSGALMSLFYADKHEHGLKEANLILGISALTSWIAPCTVWINRNLAGKQGHLITSAFVSVSAYLLSLVYLGLSAEKIDLNGFDNPPIIHCFKSAQAFANKSFHFSQNASFWKLARSTETYSPRVRICSDEEDPTTWLFNQLIVAACLCGVTLLSSFVLFHLSNSRTIYNYLGCSKSFKSYVVEILFDPQSSGKVDDVQPELSIVKELSKGEMLTQSTHFALHFFKWKNKLSDTTQKIFRRICNHLSPEPINLKIWNVEVELELHDRQVTVECPPLHADLFNGNFGLFIALKVLGGNIACTNGSPRNPSFWLKCALLDSFEATLNSDLELSMRRKIEEKISETNCFVLWALKQFIREHNRNDIECAVRENDAKFLRILLDNGYDPNVDIEGKQPLHLAVERGEPECLKILIESQANVHGKDFQGRKPLHYAATKEDAECMKLLVENQTQCVNAQDNNGKTPLHYAAESEAPKCLEILIENKADVNARTNEGATPIYFAAANRATECLKILIGNRADVNAKDNYGSTPLHVSAELENTECLTILIHSHADVNAKCINGKTPLHYAARQGSTDCLKILLQNHADVNARDTNEKTPLHYAADKGANECLKHLIEHQADVNAKDIDGRTPLYYAAKKGAVECLKVLIKSMADVNAADFDGKAPLYYASEIRATE